MKVSVGGMCRGQGTAYVLLIVKGSQKTDVLSCTARSEDGLDLPAEMYLFDTQADRTRFVVATPLLDTRTVRFEVSVEGEGSERQVLTHFTFSRFMIKWRGRLFYRMESELAKRVRDIDRVAYSNQVHVKPISYGSDAANERSIVKGIVCTPADCPSFQLVLLAGDGSVVEGFSPYISQPHEATFFGAARRETTFTARIPQDGKTYCLVASSEDNRLKSGWLCLDPASREFYQGTCSPYMYRASSPDLYDGYILARQRMGALASPQDYPVKNGPRFSVVVPLYKTPVPFLQAMVQSVVEQIYPSWELILLNASPEDRALGAALDTLDDERIRIVPLEGNEGIAGNTNVGIDAAQGDFVVFFDHDDTLDRFALYEYAKHIAKDASIDALYCDEDFLNEEGEYVAPHFKSDFNLDLLRSHNYITHLLAVRASYAKELKLRSAFDGAQDYDFLLRLVERTQHIVHVQQVLYHWRISDTSTAKSAGNKNYADDAGRRALQEHYDRLGIDATAELTDAACFYHTKARVSGNPLVSVIIPNKDCADVLARCIDSIVQKTTYANYEIIVVENNSTEPETFAYYEHVVEQYDCVRVLTWHEGFNYSLINNFAADEAQGEYLLFLNNDTEVIEPDWMTTMVAYCQREDVGVVGAKLLYPDDTVQHAGVSMIHCNTVNDLGGPIHVFINLDRDDPGYMRRAVLTQDLSAVTAACMMTKASLFRELGGFDGTYVVAFNDVDYCFRVRRAGKLVVFNPDVLLYHYESLSRGADNTPEHAGRFMREQSLLRRQWIEYYTKGDPYHGPACTSPVLPLD